MASSYFRFSFALRLACVLCVIHMADSSKSEQLPSPPAELWQSNPKLAQTMVVISYIIEVLSGNNVVARTARYLFGQEPLPVKIVCRGPLTASFAEGASFVVLLVFLSVYINSYRGAWSPLNDRKSLHQLLSTIHILLLLFGLLVMVTNYEKFACWVTESTFTWPTKLWLFVDLFGHAVVISLMACSNFTLRYSKDEYVSTWSGVMVSLSGFASSLVPLTLCVSMWRSLCAILASLLHLHTYLNMGQPLRRKQLLYKMLMLTELVEMTGHALLAGFIACAYYIKGGVGTEWILTCCVLGLCVIVNGQAVIGTRTPQAPVPAQGQPQQQQNQLAGLPQAQGGHRLYVLGFK